MRKVRGSVFVSLDGVAAPGGQPRLRPGDSSTGWLPQFFDEEVCAASRHSSAANTPSAARRTYDIFALLPYVVGEASG